VSAFALQSSDSIRSAEAAGRAEAQWASAISRIRWAAIRMAVPAILSLPLLALSGAAIGMAFATAVGDSSQISRLLWASIAYWPSILLVIGVVVLCAGFIPRAASAVTWGLFGIAAVVSMLGDLFGLPDWVIRNTPFTAVAPLGEDPSALPVIVLAALAILTGALGLARLRARDLVGA
jgi:ABC-2 type transport system permease protein